MRYTTTKRSLRSNNCLTKTSSKKLKISEENHDNQAFDVTSSNISLTTSVANANQSITSNNEDLDLGGMNQHGSDAEAHNKSSTDLINNKSSNVNAKANGEPSIPSTNNKTPRVNPVISLVPPNQLNSSTIKDQWRNQSLQTDASLNRQFSDTPMPYRRLNKNGMVSTPISTKAYNPTYNTNKATASVLHASSSNVSMVGTTEYVKDKSSPLNSSLPNISSGNGINTKSSISITRRPTVRKIVQNNTSTTTKNSAFGSTANNRSPASMPINTRSLIEGSLEYRELKRLLNAEIKKNEEWSKDYALLKKEFEQTRSSSIPRPAAPVVDWLEEVLLSLDEGQYQGDGRSKEEVADTLGLDAVSLLTVVGRTAQKTALKIFRRKYPTPRARAAIGSIVEMDEEELHNIYAYSRWLHRKYHYSIADMRKAIATAIRNAVNHVRKLAHEQEAQLNAISSATDLNDQERDEQVQSALDKLQQALDQSILDIDEDEDEDEDYEEEFNFIED